MFVAARATIPLSKSWSVSKENEEKVVKPPKKPTIKR